MAKFYQYKKPTDYFHSAEDVRLDYFMHFWTVDSITQTNLWNLLVSKIYSADGYQYLLWYGGNYYYEIEVRNQKQQTLDTIKITDVSSKQALRIFENIRAMVKNPVSDIVIDMEW